MDRKSLVRQELIDNTFVVRMNSVSITEQFLEDLNNTLDKIELLRKVKNINGSLKAVIFKSELPNIFLAGADLVLMQKNLGDDDAMRRLIDAGHKTFKRIEDIDVPTIAAINGACLGGGFELALACDYRIATNNKATKIGLPEVSLGILPAWGGTTKLPRLIGLTKSLKVILSGGQNPAKYAMKLGLVDLVVHTENLEDKAVNFSRVAKKINRKNHFLRNPLNAVIFKKAKDTVMKKTAGNYPAPLKIIEVLKESCKVSQQESLQLEKEAFVELSKTEHCKNLIGIFFLQEKAKKYRYKNIKDCVPIANVCVTGAGTMGAGIAQWLSSRGLRVLLKDISNDVVAGGLKTIGKLFVQGVKGHKIDRPSARDSMSRITSTTEDVPLKSQDLIIEAIVENLDIKKKVLKGIEDKAGPNTILATNTSALSIDEMAEDLDRPENFVGIHFFNPVHKMKLVEVVVGSKTSDETVARAVKFVQKIGKLPVISKDSPGFIVNRILIPYLVDACRLYEDGYIPEAVDKAMIEFGMPMGPFRLMDEIGIDVCHHVSSDIGKRLNYTSMPETLELMITDGHLGKKTGRGFYKYVKGKSVKNKVKCTKEQKETIKTKLKVSLAYEAEQVFDENVAESCADINFAMIMGTGYAPFTGGPLNSK